MFDEKLTVAAWKTKPAWAVISTKDRMLPPAMEESAAKKMEATTTTLPHFCTRIVKPNSERYD
jgi:hypothetical protein